MPPDRRCSVVANLAVGYDNIDLAAAAERERRRHQHAGRAHRGHRRPGLGACCSARPAGSARPSGSCAPGGGRGGARPSSSVCPSTAGPSASSGWARSARPWPAGPRASAWTCSTRNRRRRPDAEAEVGAAVRAARRAARRERLRQPQRPVDTRDPPPHRRRGAGPHEADGRSSSTPLAVRWSTRRALADGAARRRHRRRPVSTSSSASRPSTPALLDLDNVVLLPAPRLGDDRSPRGDGRAGVRQHRGRARRRMRPLTPVRPA